MRRREFIGLFCGAAAWPFAASAQKSPRPWRIGFLAAGDVLRILKALSGARFRGDARAGYVENRDFTVEWRFAEGRFKLFPVSPRSWFEPRLMSL